jgi:hypothetical protein
MLFMAYSQVCMSSLLNWTLDLSAGFSFSAGNVVFSPCGALRGEKVGKCGASQDTQVIVSTRASMRLQKRLSMLSKLAGIFAGEFRLLREVFIHGGWMVAKRCGVSGKMTGRERCA